MRDFVFHQNEEALFADGFDEALVGVVHVFGRPPLALYDRAKVLAILRDRDGMDEEEAGEFFDFNIAGAWMGEGTPAFADFPEKGGKDVTP